MRRWRFLLPVLVLGFPGGIWAQNPALVRDINPGSPWSAGPAVAGGLLAVSGRLFFSGTGGEPAVADGAGAGSEVLADLCPGDCGSSPRFLGSVANGVALFAATPGEHDTGTGLYRTDGTRGGTYGLGRPIDRDNLYGSWVFAGGRFFFAQCADTESCALWTSDGTAAGTHALKDLPGQPTRLTAVGGKAFFFLQTDLWVSDGTAAGTALVRSLDRLAFPSIPAGGTAHLYFTAGTGNGDTELWASDGTAADTRTVTHFANPHPFFDPQEAVIRTIGDRAYVIADDVLHGAELWESDGSPAGTRRITDFGYAHPFDPSGGNEVPDVARLGGRFVFLASDGLHGLQVWTSDGTPASTALLSPVQVDVNARLVPAGGRVVFLAAGPEGGRELWGTDGTAAGTRQLAPVFSGPCCPSFSYGATAIGSTAYFTRLDDTFHVALWATDGTPAGTRRFAAPEGATDLSLFDLAQVGRRELWSTDGTVAGTVLVKDLLPGPDSSGIDQLTVAGGRLWFTAWDPVHGVELWQSDGTAAGTRLAADVWPESPSSSPDHLTAVGDRLYFGADDGLAGREPWTLDAAVPGACQAGDTRLCLAGNRFQVEIAWQDFQGHTGVGHAVALTADTGYFWFFADSNVEVVVKVLDARALNQAFWVFYGALSNVEYAITVTDTQTGLTRRYVNPSGHLASAGDTDGFGPLGSFDSKALVAPPKGSSPLGGGGWERGEARRGVAAATTCAPSAQRLCLQGNRFAVTATWKDFQGHTGTGTAVPLTADTGYFWFFSPTNVEVMTKVLDGRGVNGKFWLFYGALSNVEYTLTVTDTQTGAVKTYKNPPGQFGSVADTGAF